LDDALANHRKQTAQVLQATRPILTQSVGKSGAIWCKLLPQSKYKQNKIRQSFAYLYARQTDRWRN
jgi:hypothetical protein